MELLGASGRALGALLGVLEGLWRAPGEVPEAPRDLVGASGRAPEPLWAASRELLEASGRLLGRSSRDFRISVKFLECLMNFIDFSGPESYPGGLLGPLGALLGEASMRAAGCKTGAKKPVGALLEAYWSQTKCS